MKNKKYLCPDCKSELKLVSQPQYHNEYILYFKCNNCNFRTDDVHSYKDKYECIKMMIKIYGIIVENYNNDNNKYDNKIKNRQNINNRNYFENLIN